MRNLGREEHFEGQVPFSPDRLFAAADHYKDMLGWRKLVHFLIFHQKTSIPNVLL